MNHEPCKIEEIDVVVDVSAYHQERYCGYLIKECHTYEDIGRLIIQLGWEDDLMALLSNPEFVAKAKAKAKGKL